MKRLAAALLALAACHAAPARPLSPRLTAQTVTPLAGGDPRALAELGGGKPILVDLYATWCKECRRQIAKLEALAAEVGDRLVIVGVDVGDELDAARTFADREHITYPTFGDPDLAFIESMGIEQLPAMFVVDATGAVVLRAEVLDDATRAKVLAVADGE